MGPSQLYYTVIALEWQHQLLDTFYEIADKKHTIFPLSYLHETNECPPFFHSFPRRFLAWNLPPRHHSRSRRYSHVCRLLSLNFNCIVVQFASYIRFTLLFSIERPTYYVSIELKFNQYDGARIYRHCLALLKHEQNTPSIRHFASFLWSILDCSVVNGLQWWHFTLNDEDNNCMCVTNTDFQYYWLLLFFFTIWKFFSHLWPFKIRFTWLVAQHTKAKGPRDHFSSSHQSKNRMANKCPCTKCVIEYMNETNLSQWIASESVEIVFR